MKRKKLNIKKLILFILMIIFFFLFILSISKIIKYFFDNKETTKIQEEIKEKNIVTTVTSNNDNNNENQIIEYSVDFEKLKNENSDAVGYLIVKGTSIEYVIVKSSDNAYYLNHNFNKKSSSAGWVFADYHNRFDGTDKNIVIYGHSMKNGSMFGTLRTVLTSDWQNNEENHKIILITETGIHYYQVFSTYKIDAEDYYINTEFSTNNEYLSFLNKLKSRTNHNYNIEVNKDDTILTLSTCASNGTKRVVLHAKEI